MNNVNQNINFGLPEPSDEELELIEKEIERLVQKDNEWPRKDSNLRPMP